VHSYADAPFDVDLAEPNTAGDVHQLLQFCLLCQADTQWMRMVSCVQQMSQITYRFSPKSSPDRADRY